MHIRVRYIPSLQYSELDIKSESKIHVPTTWCITISSMANFQRKSPYIPKLNLPSLAGLLHSGISKKTFSRVPIPKVVLSIFKGVPKGMASPRVSLRAFRKDVPMVPLRDLTKLF